MRASACFSNSVWSCLVAILVEAMLTGWSNTASSANAN